MKPIQLIAIAIIANLVGCHGPAAQSPERAGVDLAEARRGFQTALKIRGPAPQEFYDSSPPAGVREVYYKSGDLKLKAWLSEATSDGKRLPAVVYLHGGWAFSSIDWEDAAPFVAAGFVLMMPMLRAENGNPGFFEGFYGEVDDAIAAGRFVSELPYVDPGNVFVAGHSVGAVLTVLTVMMPSKYKAGAALSGTLDMKIWLNNIAALRSVVDLTDPEEVRLRNPMAFASSLRIPLILYAERGGMARVNADFAALAERAGKPCELEIAEGDHMSMVAPSVQHAIGWFTGKIRN